MVGAMVSSVGPWWLRGEVHSEGLPTACCDLGSASAADQTLETPVGEGSGGG